VEEKVIKGKAVEKEVVRNWKKHYGIKEIRKSRILE